MDAQLEIGSAREFLPYFAAQRLQRQKAARKWSSFDFSSAEDVFKPVGELPCGRPTGTHKRIQKLNQSFSAFRIVLEQFSVLGQIPFDQTHHKVGGHLLELVASGNACADDIPRSQKNRTRIERDKAFQSLQQIVRDARKPRI